MSEEIKNQIEEEVTGKTFEDMPAEEMAEVQGAGDVDPETTPACIYVATGALSLATGAVVSWKKC